MRPQGLVVLAMIVITLMARPAQGQHGSYAVASAAKPVTLTAAGGLYIYDFLGDRGFAFGALRVARDYGRFAVVEGSAQIARLSTVTPTAPNATTFARETFPQGTVDGSLQLQLPVWRFAPYAGLGVGYYRLAQSRTIHGEGGLSRVGMAGVRIAVSERSLLRFELRGRSDQHRRGHSDDVELGGGLGFRF